MTKIGIEANIDLYGSKARLSAIADFLEALALSGGRMTQADLGDYISDNDWLSKLHEHFEGPGIDDDDDDDDDEDDVMGESRSDAAARSVFDLIAERAEVLGELYPFEVAGEKVVLRARPDPRYLVLLGISLAHAYDLPTASELDPKVVLEDVAVAVMQCHLRARNTAFATQSGTFKDRLTATCKELGFSATPENAVISRYANDEGVDVLCVFNWKDTRPGRWAFIGQVTCAKSDDWKIKLSEPKPNKWKELLNTRLVPIPFLAVPYHVEHGQLLNLIGSENAAVLDRLRLTPFVPTDNEVFNEFVTLAKEVTVS